MQMQRERQIIIRSHRHYPELHHLEQEIREVEALQKRQIEEIKMKQELELQQSQRQRTEVMKEEERNEKRGDSLFVGYGQVREVNGELVSRVDILGIQPKEIQSSTLRILEAQRLTTAELNKKIFREALLRGSRITPLEPRAHCSKELTLQQEVFPKISEGSGSTSCVPLRATLRAAFNKNGRNNNNSMMTEERQKPFQQILLPSNLPNYNYQCEHPKHRNNVRANQNNSSTSTSQISSRYIPQNSRSLNSSSDRNHTQDQDEVPCCAFC